METLSIYDQILSSKAVRISLVISSPWQLPAALDLGLNSATLFFSAGPGCTAMCEHGSMTLKPSLICSEQSHPTPPGPLDGGPPHLVVPVYCSSCLPSSVQDKQNISLSIAPRRDTFLIH